MDGYGVGTSLVTGSGAPTCGFVYKLVARAESDAKDAAMIPVAKNSAGKPSIGGRKFALRRLNTKGRADAEVVGIGTPPDNDGNDRPLMVQLMRKGKAVGREPLEAARDRHARARAELPQSARKMSQGDPAIPTIVIEAAATSKSGASRAKKQPAS